MVFSGILKPPFVDIVTSGRVWPLIHIVMGVGVSVPVYIVEVFGGNNTVQFRKLDRLI